MQKSESVKFFDAKNPKDLRSDLHNKTHFKAALTLTLMKEPGVYPRENRG